MADIASLIKALKDTAVAQYGKGAPYREALASALKGDMSGVNQALSKSDLTPMDIATTFAPMGMFIGKSSAAFNPSKADLFAQLEAKGVSPKETWHQTGTLRGPEGELRQEISDKNSIFTPPVTDWMKFRDEMVAKKFGKNFSNGSLNNKDFKTYLNWERGLRNEYDKLNTNPNQKLETILEHPELYNAVPNAADINTFAHPNYTSDGSYHPASNTIEYGNPSDFDASKGLMLHEIQHKIQEDENWAKGGSSKEFYNQALKEKEDIFNHINKLNNEMSVLAKNSQMTPEQKTAYDFLMNARQELVPEAQKYTDPVNLMQMAQDKYKSLAGEAEARLTQRRMNLTSEERLQYFPYANDKANFGLDMPFESLLVRK